MILIFDMIMIWNHKGENQKGENQVKKLELKLAICHYKVS